MCRYIYILYIYSFVYRFEEEDAQAMTVPFSMLRGGVHHKIYSTPSTDGGKAGFDSLESLDFQDMFPTVIVVAAK